MYEYASIYIRDVNKNKYIIRMRRCAKQIAETSTDQDRRWTRWGFVGFFFLEIRGVQRDWDRTSGSWRYVSIVRLHQLKLEPLPF